MRRLLLCKYKALAKVKQEKAAGKISWVIMMQHNSVFTQDRSLIIKNSMHV